MNQPTAPSVNYHLTKACNMKCKFCFATFKDIPNIKIDVNHSKELITAFAEYGFTKITFVGGEPTLVRDLPELLEYAKKKGLITSFVTNGALLAKQEMFDVLTSNVDWIGLSIDSLDADTNLKSGRHLRKDIVLDRSYYKELSLRISEAQIKLKINTVVSAYNWQENISDFIDEVNPSRWKLMQAISVSGQNSHEEGFQIKPWQYKSFIERNQPRNGLAPIHESEDLIRGSYIMVSPDGKFFDSETGEYQYSDSILKVGVSEAIGQIHFNNDKFLLRGGIYKW
jgi:radical S-adenosyl methionine domain-containing protein 2